jgi:hypothetical protein
MRQRISRLVRKTLSFSKKLENHIGAIWYFIHHYNASLSMYEIFHYIFILFTQKCATIIRELKEGYMKVNYPERIDATASELKIILSEQRTVTRSTKNSNTLLVEIRI